MLCYWGVTYEVWVKSLTKEEIQDYKEMFKDYENPLRKAYCWVWGDEDG